MDPDKSVLHADDPKPPIEKWQKTVDLMAELYDVTGGFIVQHTSRGYQVTVSSDTPGNPYPAGADFPKQLNIFCRHAAAANGRLYVRDARADPVWNDNPELTVDGILSYLGVPIHWPGGDLFGTICVMDRKAADYSDPYIALIAQFRDIIQGDLELLVENRRIRAQADDLERARRDAERASTAKSDFVTRVNHELRTPLNAVLGFSEVLVKAPFGPLGDERYADYAGEILSGGRYLLSLVDDLMDLSSIESGHYELRERRIALCDVVEDCLSIIRPQADAKRQTLSVLGTLEVGLYADPRALKQILLNLLSNAVKYTPESGRIAIRAETRSGCRITVTDSGIGIPAEQIETIFDPFERGANLPENSPTGTGIGLAITRELAQLHGADIWLRSSVGTGTEATLALPPERTIGT